MSLLGPEDFEPWVGRKVRVNALPQPVEITLDRVVRHSPLARSIDFREPFSLFFRAPRRVYLLDTSYQLDCGRGGPHEIFLTQMKPSTDARHYEAVFS